MGDCDASEATEEILSPDWATGWRWLERCSWCCCCCWCCWCCACMRMFCRRCVWTRRFWYFLASTSLILSRRKNNHDIRQRIHKAKNKSNTNLLGHYEHCWNKLVRFTLKTFKPSPNFGHARKRSKPMGLTWRRKPKLQNFLTLLTSVFLVKRPVWLTHGVDALLK